MKKTFTRITSTLLSALILCGAISATSISAAAATSESAAVAASIAETDSVGLTSGNFIYEVNNNTKQAKITKYTGTDKNVSIPQKINNYTVTTIGYGAFQYNRLESVTFPNSVTTIDQSAFEYCSELKTIKFGTGLTTIGRLAFYGAAVTSVTIPSGVTKIDDYAFSNCTKLKTITLNDKLTEIGEGAFGSTAVETIKIPNSVKKIGFSAFYKCKSLKSVTLGNSVESIGQGCFADCTTLESISIPGKVKTISSEMFFGCSALKSVVFNSGTQTIGQCFNSTCKSLTTVTIPETVTKIGTKDNTMSNIWVNEFFDLPLNQITIRTYENSFAHKFAKANGIKFELIKIATPQISKLESKEKGINITWNAVSGASAYRVYAKNAKGEWARLNGDVTGTTKLDSNVTYGASKTYTVRALDSKGNLISDYNKTGWTVKYAVTTPQISSLKSTEKGVTVSWNKVSDATTYRVYYKNTKGAWTRLKNDVKGTSMVDTSVAYNASRTYTIRAVNSKGEVISGYNTSGKTAKYAVATPQISSLKSTEKGVTISWNKVSDVTTYRVYYKNAKGVWTRFKNDVKGTSMVDTSVKYNASKTYTVRAVNSKGAVISGYNTSGKTAKYAVATPQISKLQNTSKGVNITWNKIDGVSAYRVYYKNAKGVWTRFKNDVKGTSMVDTGVKNGEKKTYTVRAVNSKGEVISGYNTTGKSITYKK